MTRKTTKRALGLSFVSLLLCITMLMGTTFAWFTDNAAVAVNTIQAGTIDIRLVNPVTGDNLEGEELKFVNKNGETDILWEPGATYYTQPVRVMNYSNLSFYMYAFISGFKGDLELLDAIEFKIVHAYACLPASQGGLGLSFDQCNGRSYVYAGTGTVFTGEGKNGDNITADSMGIMADWTNQMNDYDSDGDLEAGPGVGEAKPLYDLCIIAKMKEDAGNQYQGKKLTGAAMTFVATQSPDEYDSYDDQYDADATFPIVTKAQLDEALADDSIKNLAVSGGRYDETVYIPDGKSMTSDGATFDTSAKQYSMALVLEADANVTLNDGTYANAGGPVQIIDAQADGSKLVINGGTYSGGAVVWVYGETDVVINGGTFNTWGLAVTDSGSNEPVIVNGGTFNLGIGGIDGGTGCDITINGGTFNVDPTNWLGEGKTATEANGTWTVK